MNQRAMIEFQNPVNANLADRCIRPLCFGAAGDEHYGLSMFQLGSGRDLTRRVLQLGLQGSSTLISYRQKHFAVFTRHQIAEVPNESIGQFRNRMELLFVLMDDGQDSTNLPFHTLVFAFDGVDGDDEDDLVVAVIEEAMMTDYMRAQFFPAGRSAVGVANDRALCAGFPSHLQQVVMERDGLLINPICKSGIVFTRSARSTGTIRYKNDWQPLDGMSGGAVFLCRLKTVSKNNPVFVIFIDGIIQRAGNGYIHYLTIERVLDKIDEQVFDSR